jgi:hypothetical protein
MAFGMFVASFFIKMTLRGTNIPSHGRGTYICIVNGCIYVSIAEQKNIEFAVEFDASAGSPIRSSNEFRNALERGIFRFFRIGLLRKPTQWIFAFPALFILLLLVIVWHRRCKMRDKGPERACRNCGYDLRASPDGCPECGPVNVAEGADTDKS